MKLKVNPTTQDISNFSDCFFETSETIKSTVFKQRLFMAVSPLLGGIFVVLFKDLSMMSAVIVLAVLLVLFGLPVYFYYPRIQKRKYKKEILKLFAEGSNKGVLGLHEFTIEDDGFREKTDVNETKQSWGSMEKIIQHKSATYVFLNSIQAHVLPEKSVIEGDYNAFVDELKNRILKAG